jgi:dolichol-phosphate mannosyltransferase
VRDIILIVAVGLLVGLTGVVIHMSALQVAIQSLQRRFGYAQVVATVLAVCWNFALNNMLTYRDCRLVGWRAVRGLASFMALCGLGALVNVAVARDVFEFTGMWLVAGIAGAGTGALLNYALTSIFTWGRRP